ncbi:MAG TPA: hypothetical protein VGX03_16060 [Candidatus Binatia bacterium]|jgi:hypothetical protein|nr:hypothetical protein [Candidatus Binatia bacterium]
MATALILGLTALPFTGRAEDEKAGEGNQETHHAGDHPHAHKSMKKAAKTNSETKKTGSPAAEGTSEQPHDSQGVRGSSLDDIEGSH